MTIDEAVALIQRLTYRPGDRIAAKRCEDLNALRVSLKRAAPDSTGARESAALRSEQTLSSEMIYYWDGPQLLAHIRGWLHEAEMHESDEWLKLDGECLCDPHKKPEDDLLTKFTRKPHLVFRPREWWV